jgi:hypothetical protein
VPTPVGEQPSEWEHEEERQEKHMSARDDEQGSRKQQSVKSKSHFESPR